jgi:thioredoxin-related protein
MTSRRLAFLLTLSALSVALGLPRLATSKAFTLPAAQNLKRELTIAESRQQPLIVMVSLDGCAFCKVARENYLSSLQRDQGLMIVQVDLGKNTAIVDFQGRNTTHQKIIQEWGIKLAPTLLFFGKDGKEIVDRLVGGTSSDFYGAYLEERVSKALQLSKP